MKCYTCNLNKAAIDGIRCNILEMQGYTFKEWSPSMRVFLKANNTVVRPSLYRWIKGDKHFIVIYHGFIVAKGSLSFHTPERPNKPALITFYTNKAHRGKGLYPALIEFILHYLKKQGFTKAYIWTSDSNIASQKGIEKTAFKLGGVKEDES